MEVLYDEATQRLPIFNWAEGLDDECIRQAKNLSNLPFAVGHISLMPDAHGGYGMPVGGVLATKGYVVPNAIGVDIGCGMCARKTNIQADMLHNVHPGQGTILQAILSGINRNVPTGNGPRGNNNVSAILPESLHRQHEQTPMTDETRKLDTAFENSGKQLGTLGGGNHFIELDVDEDGFVWLMLHSGSRAFGFAICKHFNELAKKLNERYFSTVSSKTELNFLDLDSQDGKSYVQWMHLAQEYARLNRERMLNAAMSTIEDVMHKVMPEHTFRLDEVAIDTHHNYGAFENHLGKDVFVVRKGAVRARQGEQVIIPGSMETGSYIATGKGNPDSFTSSPHGAGRKMSRTKARASFQIEDMITRMKERGIVLVTDSVKDVLDESGPAYKDIEEVISLSADLVEPHTHLSPLGVLKGSDSFNRGRH